MRYVFRLPDVGEGIHEAEFVKYEVKNGDKVAEDQEILKVETDKAVVSLPSPAAGVIVETPHKEGDVITVGDPLIIIETEKDVEIEETPAPAEASAARSTAEGDAATAADAPAARPAESTDSVVKIEDKVVEEAKRILATPHTRHLARELGVDISKITGSGPRGRVTDDDVRKAKEDTPVPPPKIPSAGAVSHEPSTMGFDFEKYGPTRREPLKSVRKRIAEVMVRSYSTIPHVSHADEADVTELFDVVKKQKPMAKERGIKLTVTSFLAKSVVSALQVFPEVNSSLDEVAGELVYKEHFHIGIATDTEIGLMVPVVKDADKKTILQIAEDIERLAEEARNREIDIEDLRGGTFSITNPGGIGGIHATPIIQHPQVAILGVLAARRKPVVKDEQIVVRTIMPLVISFDHRILDGAVAARFLNHIIQLLEDPMRMLVDVI
jgi:pyruvate dehydrogenase E2 component (dihydrolipoamide acetyltransferase)